MINLTERVLPLRRGSDLPHSWGMRYALLATFLVGCGAAPLPLEQSYRAEYTMIATEGNCPPYAPETLQVGPRIDGDRTCLWAPLDAELGVNLLCGFAAPTRTELLAWDPEARSGKLRIAYVPTCSAIYDVALRPVGR
jgi:hypothetical protein